MIQQKFEPEYRYYVYHFVKHSHRLVRSFTSLSEAYNFLNECNTELFFSNQYYV